MRIVCVYQGRDLTGLLGWPPGVSADEFEAVAEHFRAQIRRNRMALYRVNLKASPAGALALETVERSYLVNAYDQDDARDAAIARAIEEGLEHIFIVRVVTPEGLEPPRREDSRT